MKTIKEFQGEYRFLSNFWFAKVILDGKEYSSVEHAYQAAKTLDEKEREEIRLLAKPGDAKRYSKLITLRENWTSMSLSIMEDLVFQKFSKNLKLKKQLLDTGDAILEEGNKWHDTFWGICDGKGENHLGKILMKVRDRLK